MAKAQRPVRAVNLAVMPAELAQFALGLPEVTEEQPFGPGADVYKVTGKIFAIISPERIPPAVALKCDPLMAIALREEYEAVIPGYHLNKKHWNTVILDGTIPDVEIEDMVLHSYERVIAGLPRVVRHRLESARSDHERLRVTLLRRGRS
jgi:predicted DNA-binding protein (MmcQ/YjbR family)